MRWYVGGDHGAVELRRVLVEHLRAHGHEVAADIGPRVAGDSVDYPDIAVAVCRQLLADPGSFGLLVCGSGQGVAIAANRIKGIRAAVVTETYSARMARQHNDANVLCMGGRVVGPGLAVDVFEAFAGAAFEGGRHQRRVGKIEAIDATAVDATAVDATAVDAVAVDAAAVDATAVDPGASEGAGPSEKVRS
jgi:ribose 5-phosphate isomerase B